MNRLKKVKLKYFIKIMFVLTLYIVFLSVIPTFMRYYSRIEMEVTGRGIVNYAITYIDDGVEETVPFESDDLPITLSNPTKAGYTFLGWYESADFSGENLLEATETRDYIVYAKWLDEVKVAEIDGVYFETLQAAIDAVPTTGVETTIRLLANTSEALQTKAGQNIIFNFQNYTVSNDGNTNVFKNYATIQIYNGTISTNASTNGAINNETGGTLIMTGGRIIMTGGRQCIYNHGGTATISGDAYLFSSNAERATVHNLADSGNKGTLTITGGTIISTGFYAVKNDAGVTTIGIKDGDVSTDSPVIQGVPNGIYTANSATFNFYDGIVKGKTAAFYNNHINNISDKETGYEVLTSETEVIDGETYRLAYLKTSFTVTFNANGGSVTETTRIVTQDTQIGTLPAPTRSEYVFEGWYTALENGDKVESTTIITHDVEYFAIWIHESEITTAKIGDKTYPTLKAAVNDVPKTKTETIVTLLRNTSEAIVIDKNQNIVFNLQNFTLSNSGSYNVIKNNGTLKIYNGTIKTNATQGAINNEETGSFIMSGGKIIATGTRQCIYNNGGVAVITGSAQLSSSTNERSTVHNLNGGHLTITGGTITSTGTVALKNDGGTVIIGSSDGNVKTNTPVIKGNNYGICNNDTMNFYDGVIYGKLGIVVKSDGLEDYTNFVIDEFSALESGYELTQVEEALNGTTYQKGYLTETVIVEPEPDSEPTPDSNSEPDAGTNSDPDPESTENPENQG